MTHNHSGQFMAITAALSLIQLALIYTIGFCPPPSDYSPSPL